MLTGISSASFFARENNQNVPALLRQHSVPMCEIFLESFSEYKSSFMKTIADNAIKNNVAISSIHPMSQQFEPQLFSISLIQKEDAMHIYRTILQNMQAIDVHRYVMHGPALLVNNSLKNVQLERIGPIIAQLANTAKEYNVRLCFENVSWCLFQYPTFPQDIKPYCDTDNLYFTLDIKQAVRSGHNPFDFLKHMAHRVENVHLCDYRYREDESIQLCLPGDGIFDFEKLFDLLKKQNYAGNALIEVYSDMYSSYEELFKSFDYMLQLST